MYKTVRKLYKYVHSKLEIDDIMKEGRTIKLIRQKVAEGIIDGRKLTSNSLRKIGIRPRTACNFMPKHRIGSPGRDTELFERNNDGTYHLLG